MICAKIQIFPLSAIYFSIIIDRRKWGRLLAFYSHTGNEIFPRWEQNIPTLGIINELLVSWLVSPYMVLLYNSKNFIKIKKGIADNKTLSIFAEYN